jgi:hypothetical protein
MLLTTTIISGSDAGRRVKRADQMHCDHYQTIAIAADTTGWAAQFQNQQPNERGDKVTADKGPMRCLKKVYHLDY